MQVIAISNKLKCIPTADCNSKVVKYNDSRFAFGFDYPSNPSFTQQVRLGIYLRSPKYATKEKVYRQTDGVFRYGNVSTDKSYELHTDVWDEETHDAMIAALKHKTFYIDDVLYNSQGEYQLEDNEYNNLSNGKAIVFKQGFNLNNISC